MPPPIGILPADEWARIEFAAGQREPRDGLIDVLSSDYVPTSLLPASFRLVAELGYSLPAAIRMAATRPADAMGLTDRGRIAPGLRADLVRVAERLKPRDAPTSLPETVVRIDNSGAMELAGTALLALVDRKDGNFPSGSVR